MVRTQTPGKYMLTENSGAIFCVSRSLLFFADLLQVMICSSSFMCDKLSTPASDGNIKVFIPSIDKMMEVVIRWKTYMYKENKI